MAERKSILEKYAPSLSVSESFYGKNHNGAKLSATKKLVIAKCLENTNKYLTEAFESSMGTQRADMGDYKKFCLNLVTLALPNSIAEDLVIVSPMASFSGSIAYLQYVAGTGSEADTVYNSVWGHGEMTESRMTYTASPVVENFDVGDTATDNFTVTWAPAKTLTKTAIENIVATDTTTGDGLTVKSVEGKKITFTASVDADHKVKIGYFYDNESVPQETLPTLKAVLKRIPLEAKIRRIAVYYSQIAAFQAKTDYGFNMEADLPRQAIGELTYEIDSEIVNMLVNGAEDDADLVWSKTQPVGVNLYDHYAGFMAQLELAKAKMYKRTQKFTPNYMITDPMNIPVLALIPSYKAANNASINGPYEAGSINGLKVFVSPMITGGKYVLGVNGSDLQTSAGVYAPYMPIVPTQLLGHADGSLQQGFSTAYDLKLLSTYTGSIAAGSAVPSISGEVGDHSYLLIAGKIAD